MGLTLDFSKRPRHGTRPVRIVITLTFFVLVLVVGVAMFLGWIAVWWVFVVLILMYAASYAGLIELFGRHGTERPG